MIRLLTPGDAEAFRAVRLEGLRAHPSAFGSDVEDEISLPLENFAERIVSGHVCGAFDGGELVGVLGVRPQRGRKERHKGTLWGVYTKPAYRGRGLSARLLDFAVAEARKLGLEWLNLVVASQNEAARRLYASRGFIRYGQEPAGLKIDGVDYDDDLMTLKL